MFCNLELDISLAWKVMIIQKTELFTIFQFSEEYNVFSLFKNLEQVV